MSLFSKHNPLHPIVWEGNHPEGLRYKRTGFIELAFLSLLTSMLPGLSNFAIGALTAGLTAVTVAGIGLAANLAFQQSPPTMRGQDVQSNIRQSLSARRRHYGRTKVGSVIVFGFRRGEKIYVLHYIGEGPIEGYAGFFLDRKPVPLDEDGFVTNNQYVVKDVSRMQLLTTLGTMADEPFAALIAAFPELDRPLKPFRARGCAMVLQIIEEVNQADLASTYPNNLPSLEVLIDGLLIYDPRSETTALSGNAGVCLLAETMDVYKLTPADTAKLDFAGWSAFANHCDEPVGLKAGGTENRYRCAGTVLMDAENEKRIKAIADICNAEVFINPAGQISVRKRVSSTPSIDLTYADGDHLSVIVESGRRKQKKFNAVKVIYREAQLNWKENEAYYRNAAAKIEDGEELIEPLPAQLCPSGTQGQRLGKLFYHEMNPDYVGSLTSGVQALELIADPVFTIDLAPEDDLAFTARAGGLEFDPQSQVVSCQIQSVAADAEAWDAATEEQDVVELPPDLPTNVNDIALDVTVTVGVLENSAPVLEFSWERYGGGDIPDAYSQLVEVARAGTDEWDPAVVNQEEHTARFGPVADNAEYDWRIRNVRGGKKFDWQESDTPVLVQIDTVAPQALQAFTVTAGDHLGYVQFNIVTKPDTHLARVVAYLVPAGGVLDKDVHQKIVIPAASNASFSYGFGDSTRTNMLTNGDFAGAGPPPSLGTGWTIGSGTASHSATSGASIFWGSLTIANATDYRMGVTINSITGTSPSLTPRFTNTLTDAWAAETTSGLKLRTHTTISSNNTFGFLANTNAVINIDGAILFAATPACAPQGTWDLHSFTENISGVDTAGPVASGVVIV